MKSIKIYGHISAMPEKFATLLNGEVSLESDPEADCAIFVINPSAGIDAETIRIWQELDDYLTPRLVLVTVLDGMELDFDDAVLLANRVFAPLLTPYLVLHGESGTPIGLISLEDLSTIDYSTDPIAHGAADEELVELVKEFQEEYFDAKVEMEDGAFAAGIIFPAIPVNPANGLGIDIVKNYLAELPSSS